MLMNYVGIDGCKAGWLAWSFQSDIPVLSICKDLDELARLLGTDGHWLIDMPIGFSTPQWPDRLCDKEARKLLGVRRSSIFTVPCREAVYAPSYERACEVNFQLLGKKFSKQTWGIVPKIRELDLFLTESIKANKLIVRESHPELAFAGLAGRPMSFNKKTKEGRQERLAVLRDYAPQWFEVLVGEMQKTPRRIAEPDDVIDAFVLMLISLQSKDLVSLPLDYSEIGASPEIVYLPTCVASIPQTDAVEVRPKQKSKSRGTVHWRDLLNYLQGNVQAGTVTTYKRLSEYFYGHPGATQAIISMLKAAVANDLSNSLWTNRVVGADGKVVDVNGQKAQLLKEGVVMRDNKILPSSLGE